MKKKFLFILMMLMPVMTWADDSGTCGDNLTWTYNESTKTLSIEGSGDMGNYSYVSQLPWYYYRSRIEKIIIGDGVTSIGSSAFYGCSSLVSFTIPNSVTTIGNSAFADCSSLASIIIPNSVTSIYDYAFYDSGLTSVTIPNSVKTIGNYAFCNCSNLASITIGNGVTSIGNNAFQACSSLISIVIPNGVSSIESQVFYQCTSLTSVNIPNSVTSIGAWAFEGCSSLVSVNIPNSVTSIRERAFKDCSSLVSVNIPKSVVSIVYNSFIGCTSLASIMVETENTKFDSRENCNAIIAKASNTLFIGCKSTFIPNSVTSINSSAFEKSGITSIVIPSSVTKINTAAFRECKDLTSVTFSNGLTTIEKNAFSNSGLTSIIIPSSVKDLGSYAFSGCNSLSSIIVEDGNTVYDSRENCNAIIRTEDNSLALGCKSTIIPNSVTSIGLGAFADCGSLTSIALPNSITTIGESAFERSGLSTIILPENLNVIEIRAFENTNLSSITLPYSLTNCGQSSFIGCKLKNIVIKNYNTNVYHSFSDVTFQHAILYVPSGQRWDAIYGNGGCYKFNNIREIVMESRKLSESSAYMLMNTNDFSLAVYDAVNGEVTNATSLYDIDENIASNAWQIIKGDDDNYLYNIGARQYAGIDADGKLVLSSSPVAISLRETKNGFMLGDNNGQQWGFVINEDVKPYKDLTAIDNITSSAIRDAYYSLDGQRLSQATKGLNIVRTSNGKAKKVVVK